MKKLFTPLEVLNNKTTSFISLGGVFAICLLWFLTSFGTTNLFPTPTQVFTGLGDLWANGLISELGSSLALCGKAVVASVLVALFFSYLSAIPIAKPFGKFISILRYLPLTGITFYITVLVSDARAIQVWVLVMFMTTFLTTSLMQMIKDIPEEEFDHARTLGCNRWECLWEVVIKGRLDYVIELVRQNLAIVWVMLVTVESILVAAGGLGVLIKNGDRLGNNGSVVATQIIIILTGLFIDFALTKFRQVVFVYSKY